MDPYAPSDPGFGPPQGGGRGPSHAASAGVERNPYGDDRPPARPQILAPQANDWATSGQEVDVVRNRRPGLVLLAILGVVLVAGVALVLAVFSVLNDSPDETEAGPADTSDTSLPTDSSVVDGAGAETSTPESSLPPPVDPNALTAVLTENPFLCDGGTRQFGQLSGAAPNEEIAFTSPQAAGLKSGVADADGVLPIRWQCDPAQAGTTWELTASGVTSGKVATFTFAGVAEPPASTDDTAAGQDPNPVPPPAGNGLSINLTEDPFICNGEARVFGRLSGAAPNEEVSFASPQATGIKNGTADASGNLDIRWSCGPDQAGTTWDIVATGLTSGSTASFSFTGAAG